MRKVIVNEFMTLDGVVQGPSSPQEDSTGGFAQGGWHARHTADETFRRWVVENLASAGGFLFGRRTYEIFATHWPNAGPEQRALAEPLNARPKYVASTTLTAPLGWQNSTLDPRVTTPACSAWSRVSESSPKTASARETSRSSLTSSYATLTTS